MELQPVFITKGETCLSYSFKRIGKSNLIENMKIEDIESNFDIIDYHDLKGEYKIGDLIVWTHNQKIRAIPMEITKEGILISHETMLKRHISVYEGNGLVSDVTRGLIDGSFAPSLRIRKVKEIKIRPTFIIRFDKLVNPV